VAVRLLTDNHPAGVDRNSDEVEVHSRVVAVREYADVVGDDVDDDDDFLGSLEW
jgi:hypothetical protein